MVLEKENIDLTYYALNLEKIEFNKITEIYNISNIPNSLFFSQFNGTKNECDQLNEYIKKIFSSFIKILYNSYEFCNMNSDIKSFNNAHDLNNLSSKECLNNTLTRLINKYVYPVMYNTIEYFKNKDSKYKKIEGLSDEDITNYSYNFFFTFAPFIWPITTGKLPDEENIKIIVKKYILFCLYEYIEYLNINGFNIYDNNSINLFSTKLFCMSYNFMCAIILKLKDKNLITEEELNSKYLIYISEII